MSNIMNSLIPTSEGNEFYMDIDLSRDLPSDVKHLKLKIHELKKRDKLSLAKHGVHTEGIERVFGLELRIEAINLVIKHKEANE